MHVSEPRRSQIRHAACEQSKSDTRHRGTAPSLLAPVMHPRDPRENKKGQRYLVSSCERLVRSALSSFAAFATSQFRQKGEGQVTASLHFTFGRVRGWHLRACSRGSSTWVKKLINHLLLFQVTLMSLIVIICVSKSTDHRLRPHRQSCKTKEPDEPERPQTIPPKHAVGGTFFSSLRHSYFYAKKCKFLHILPNENRKPSHTKTIHDTERAKIGPYAQGISTWQIQRASTLE